MVTWENGRKGGYSLIDLERGRSYLMEYTRSSGFAVVLCTTGGAPLNTASIVSGAFINCVRFLGALRDSTVAICAEI